MADEYFTFHKEYGPCMNELLANISEKFYANPFFENNVTKFKFLGIKFGIRC